MSDHRDDSESVRHLVALGYLDLAESEAREAVLRSERRRRLQLALEIVEQGHEQHAVALLQDLVAEDPDWISPREGLAEIHYRAGRLDDAQLHLDWLTYHGVESPRLSLIAGGIALARRDMQLAFELLEYAQFAEPTLPGVDVLLGSVALRLQRLELAEGALGRALDQNPRDVRALDGLAVISLRRGAFEEAADFALRALEIDISFRRAHMHLGIALMHLGRPEQAVQALEAAARIEPARTAPYNWLRRISEQKLVDPARAAPYRDRVKEIIGRRRAARQVRRA